MIELYGGLLVLLALGLALLPFIRPRSSARQDRAQTVRAIYRGRLDELDAELVSGQLNIDTRTELEAELGAALLADFTDTTAVTASDDRAAGEVGMSKKSRWALLTVAGLLPLASSAIYLSLGDPGALEIEGAEVVLQLDTQNHGGILSEWQDKLSSRVSAKPSDAQSWYLLGHVELKLNNYQRAAEAFAEAHKFHGNDISVDLYWLQARYLAASGQIDQGTTAIGMRILKTVPNQPLVLEMFAIDAFRESNFKEAVTFLNRALTNPLAPGQREALSSGFEAARAKLGDLKPSVDVSIEIADVESQVPEGATLFVIARPVGGGMPFAVVRRPGAKLPLTIRLDDAVSMNPAAGLSQAQVIEVVVRLSRSGQAMAQPGDWEWRSHAITLAELDDPLQLTALLNPPG
ncbi:MAG: c-type cytochrome biogenesis protein CcmI [Gammaproteobacteria bacterium]|nr:c-type cytochrome biogenesis protein CcmI [Gammaproteobacteria bacterium]